MTKPNSGTPQFSEGWLAAWQEAQRQSAQAHTAYQQAMAQSHTAYLNAMETSIATLANLAGGTAPTLQRTSLVPVAAPLPSSASIPAPVAAPVPTPVAAPVPTPVAAPVPTPVAAPVPTPVDTPVPAPVAAPAPETPSLDLHALMLSVVAEKTGYPAEMLDLSMNLEGDLGIDSIKRVEILAAVQDEAPGLPEVDASHMGTLKTLGQIVEYMQELMGDAHSAPAPAAAATPQPSNAPAVDLHALMLSVVAVSFR